MQAKLPMLLLRVLAGPSTAQGVMDLARTRSITPARRPEVTSLAEASGLWHLGPYVQRLASALPNPNQLGI